jgi:O-antigen ligase
MQFQAMRAALWGGMCGVPLLLDPWGWDAWQPIRGLVLAGMALALLIGLWQALPGMLRAVPPVIAFVWAGLLLFDLVVHKGAGWQASMNWWLALGWFGLLVQPLAASAALRRDLWRAMSVALLLQLAVVVLQAKDLLPGSPAGTMSNGNFKDAWLLCLLPGALVLVLRENGAWRLVGLLALVGGIAGVLLGHTMGAVLGLAALLPVYALAGVMRRWAAWGRRPGWTALVVLSLLVLGAVGFYGYWQQRVTQAYAAGDPGRVESEEERASLWRESVAILQVHPLGIGAGRWPDEILSKGVVAVRAGYGTRFHRHAHNDFLEVAAEYGWAAGLALVLLLAVSVWRGWQRIGRHDDWPDDLAGVGMVVAWAAFACTNYPAAQVEFLWLLVLGLAVLWRGQGVAVSQWIAHLAGLAAMALLIGCMCSTGLRIRAERLTRAMVAAHWAEDWPAMLLAGEQAEAKGLAVEHFSGTPSAWYVGAARLWMGDPAGAVAPLARAYALVPAHPQVGYAFGQALMGTGAHAQAAEVLAATVGLHPRFDWARMAWVEALLADGRRAEACVAAGFWRGLGDAGPAFKALIDYACAGGIQP